MPHDMFGDLVSRKPSIRSRRAPLVVVSVLTHALVVFALVMLSLVATEALPSPREAIDFFDTNVHMADPPPPPPRNTPRPLSQPDTPTVDPNAAPTVMPEGIAPESGIEDKVTRAPQVGLVFGTSSSALQEFVEREAPPPSPPPAPTGPVRMHSGIEAPQKISDKAPVYPAIATAARVEGLVILEATIDEAGQVVDLKVLRSVPMLEAAAIDAVKQWRYRPARLNGMPIPVIVTVTVRFALN
jgi:periplasmic protein TonB